MQEWRPSVTIITMNVDGLRNRNNGARMNDILAMLLAKGPDVLMFQEVVDEMYDVLEQRLGSREWQIKRKSDPEMMYYNVTAVRRPTDAATRYKTTSRTFDSDQGRHLLTVHYGAWTVHNVHAESGGKSTQPRQESRAV